MANPLSKEFLKENSLKAIEIINRYFEELPAMRVVPDIEPGSIEKQLSSSPPEHAENFDNVLKDLESIIIPGLTHWNHPGFMAYFNSTGAPAGIIADFISSSFNINGMLWKTSPSAEELEKVMMIWFRKMLGLPENFWGIIYDTASVSTMHAVAVAREKATGFASRIKGFSCIEKKLILYCTEYTHSSVDRACALLGIGFENIHRVPVDKNYSMIPSELERMIKEDIEKGFKPFCAVVTLGTTSVASIDPIKETGVITNKYGLWLHVDGAYGANSAILPEMRHILDGIELADSIVINPHKWMFIPSDYSAFYTKHPDDLKNTFSLIPEYLKTKEQDETINYMNYGIQLGRRFRSLKFWFVIRSIGIKGLREIFREHISNAKYFAEKISSEPGFETAAPVHLGTVCFRYRGSMTSVEEINDYNQKLMDRINSYGKIFLTHTKINSVFTIRLVASGLYTHKNNIDDALETIRNAVKE